MTKTIWTTCILLSACTTLGYAQSTHVVVSAPDGGPESPPHAASGQAGFSFIEQTHSPHATWNWSRQGQREMHAWGQAWREAKSDQQREKIKSKVNKYLDEQFAADMERREQELEQIESRLDRLREQLAKRSDKRDEIIALQLQQVTMSWDGLGWSDPQPPVAVFGVTAPTAPVPPLVRRLSRITSTTSGIPGMRGNDFEKRIRLLAKAAEEEGTDALRKLATRIAEQVTDMEAMEANQFVWAIHEELRDTVDHKVFWLPLAKAAEEKSEDLEDDLLRSLILDTAAHCYALAGDLPTAQELQAEALEASAAAHGGEAEQAIAEYHEELKSLVEDAEESQGRAR